MQIKSIVALGVFATFANVSCTNMCSDERKIDIYHCKGGMYPGSSKYYYVFRIEGDTVNISKMIPDFYAYTPQDKQEYFVEGNSDDFVSKLNYLIKNVECSEVDLREKKEVVIHIPGKSFTYYAKSDSAKKYIDAVIDVILDMYKDNKKILVKKRD